MGGGGIGTPLNCIGPGGPITLWPIMAAEHIDVDGMDVDAGIGPGPGP